MKKKLIDKKIVFLFLLMIVMIIFMIVFLSKQKEETQEKIDLGIDDRLEILSKNKSKINDFLNNNNGLFTDGLQEIFEKLDPVSYIDLPLKINSSRNEYPFGKGIDLE